MKYDQAPGGYPDFQSVVAVFEKELPEGFKIVETKEGGKMPRELVVEGQG